uniref:Uncharacterized protein n=2 Tax=environmental samples TaxID=651140 RepID=A0A075FPC4_9ARCH|nr:hypothetical protein [uncultured marine thaumarchaeote AD1000_36_B08]AIF23077.1 hypothetical protein [uncultured marine thaumarchaeote SAT1000_12_G09]
MANKGFPSFGMSQAGAFVTALKNYNLPDFILKLVAKEANSELLERGRIADRLQSMNDKALELLNEIFVECKEDKKGNLHSTDFLRTFQVCTTNVKFWLMSLFQVNLVQIIKFQLR